MTGYILEIRGFKIPVEAKSGTQLKMLRDIYENRSDEFLAQVEEDCKDILSPAPSCSHLRLTE